MAYINYESAKDILTLRMRKAVLAGLPVQLPYDVCDAIIDRLFEQEDFIRKANLELEQLRYEIDSLKGEGCGEVFSTLC